MTPLNKAVSSFPSSNHPCLGPMKGFKTGLSLINKHFIHSDFLPAALVMVYFVIIIIFIIRGDKF